MFVADEDVEIADDVVVAVVVVVVRSLAMD